MRRSWILLAVVAAAASFGFAGEPAKDLKSPDVSLRLAAVESLRTGSDGDAVALLTDALGDSDWEVVERAAVALGEKGSDAAAKGLVKLAQDAPARRIRLAAARSIAQLPGWADHVEFLARAKPDELARVLDTASAVTDVRESAALVKLVERGFGAKKEQMARIAAARAIGAHPLADRVKMLQSLSAESDSAVAAAAVDAARARPDDAYLPVLVEILGRKTTSECTARRTRAALVEAAKARAKGEAAATIATRVAEALKSPPSPAAGWHYARTLGELAELPEEHVPAATLLEDLAPALDGTDAKVRAAAAWALGRIAGDAAAERAARLAKEDSDAHVRLTALMSVALHRTAEHEPTFRLFAELCTEDPDPLVREEAAVQLGRRGVAGAYPSLRKAAEAAMAEKKGGAWGVGVAALVSLGKTRQADGVDWLIETATKAKDWKFRAAALVGLGHVQDKRAVPVLVDALGGKEPIYRNIAYEFLRRYAPDAKLAAKQADWKSWWEKNGADFRWVDREEEMRKAQKYGYAPDPTGVYEGLDVVVFQSRGDKIETLLKELNVEHRLTRSGQVMDSGLHPLALFVSNCTGEITPKDVEPIAWFVHAGGYLFGSCWALHETIEKACPGCIKKYDYKGEVLAIVEADACRPSSPFVDDVFRPHVRPMYVLWGSHLVEVQDPERAEVLMDSPWTEERFGSGNLVAWFTTGHGLVLDSSNHFERQGFGHAENLKTEDDRKAYALDHLGLTFAELRGVPAGAWKSSNDADKEAKDLSSFRFITNFVRQKRKSQE